MEYGNKYTTAIYFYNFHHPRTFILFLITSAFILNSQNSDSHSEFIHSRYLKALRIQLKTKDTVFATTIHVFNSILSIFDKCSILLLTIWPSNHTSHTKVYFNEFVANALHGNIGSKKSASILRKINEVVFSFKYQKFKVRAKYTITHNQRNQTQLHKVNDFDLCFVSKFQNAKCLRIPNSRTKPEGLISSNWYFYNVLTTYYVNIY